MPIRVQSAKPSKKAHILPLVASVVPTNATSLGATGSGYGYVRDVLEWQRTPSGRPPIVKPGDAFLVYNFHDHRRPHKSNAIKIEVDETQLGKEKVVTRATSTYSGVLDDGEPRIFTGEIEFWTETDQHVLDEEGRAILTLGFTGLSPDERQSILQLAKDWKCDLVGNAYCGDYLGRAVLRYAKIHQGDDLDKEDLLKLVNIAAKLANSIVRVVDVSTDETGSRIAVHLGKPEPSVCEDPIMERMYRADNFALKQFAIMEKVYMEGGYPKLSKHTEFMRKFLKTLEKYLQFPPTEDCVWRIPRAHRPKFPQESTTSEPLSEESIEDEDFIGDCEPSASQRPTRPPRTRKPTKPTTTTTTTEPTTREPRDQVIW